MSLLDGGTTATTGGSAQTFSRTSRQVTNGYEYADVTEASFLARQSIVLKSRMPQSLDGEWTKQKTHASFVCPIALADGSTVYNVARIEVEYHPESSAAQVAELREMAAQLAKQAALDSFYQAGTFPE
jgi:hypothetical protein